MVSGGELRNQGRYPEALRAAFDVMDNWAAADTVIAWGAKDKEIRKACEEAGFGVRLTDLQYLRNIAAVPVRNRIVSP